MSFTLQKVVPWGRSLNEYIAMFSLSPGDLKKRILGCGDGPAGFNAELSSRGGAVVSVDPIYRFTVDKIKQRIDQTYETIIEQTHANRDEFVWKNIKTVDELGSIRMKAMERFLEDFPRGAGRYTAGALPSLPFKDKQFDLALCSHFLFLYSQQYSLEFHMKSLYELCRVATEVRVFPLLELGSVTSRHLHTVLDTLPECGFECSVENVPYEFQKGGNEMLTVQSCTP